MKQVYHAKVASIQEMAHFDEATQVPDLVGLQDELDLLVHGWAIRAHLWDFFYRCTIMLPDDGLGRPNKPSGTSIRVTFMLPKRRFWKEEQKMKCGFRRKHFSMAHGPN
jgi:hypothetical protein